MRHKAKINFKMMVCRGEAIFYLLWASTAKVPQLFSRSCDIVDLITLFTLARVLKEHSASATVTSSAKMCRIMMMFGNKASIF